MLIVGLTGGLGTGKSTVAAMFKRLGAHTIDADEVVHRLLKSDGKSFKKVVRTFGKGILSRGEINRVALAKIVFNAPGQLKKLERILHPMALKEIKAEIKKLKNKRRLIIIDAPLLIEAGWHKHVDYLVVVYAKRSQQIARIKKRMRIPTAEIVRRINNQMDLRKKIAMADYKVDNSGPINQTRKRVQYIFKALTN